MKYGVLIFALVSISIVLFEIHYQIVALLFGIAFLGTAFFKMAFDNLEDFISDTSYWDMPEIRNKGRYTEEKLAELNNEVSATNDDRQLKRNKAKKQLNHLKLTLAAFFFYCLFLLTRFAGSLFS